MSRAAEDGRALLEAAQQLHAERHGAQTFLPGTYLSFLEAAKRTGIRSDASALPRRHRGSGVRGRNRVGQECEIRQRGQTLPHHPARPEDAAGTPLEARLPVV